MEPLIEGFPIIIMNTAILCCLYRSKRRGTIEYIGLFDDKSENCILRLYVCALYHGTRSFVNDWPELNKIHSGITHHRQTETGDWRDPRRRLFGHTLIDNFNNRL